MTGMFPAKLPIVAKKSPNKTNMPYSSIRKPINGHRSSIRVIPVMNAAVPFHFCRRAKKMAVFCRPIMRVRPKMKRICHDYWTGLPSSTRCERAYIAHG